MSIKCCNGCVPPKRNPYCHGSCQEYMAEKAEYDRLMAIEHERNKALGEYYGNRSQKVIKALKRRSKK